MNKNAKTFSLLLPSSGMPLEDTASANYLAKTEKNLAKNPSQGRSKQSLYLL